MKPLATNWCATCVPNFGDALTPALLLHYRIPYSWTAPPRCELMVSGSIISKLPTHSKAMILGTGLIDPQYAKPLPNVRVLAVRGKFTRDLCGLPANSPLGDPGILAPDLLRDGEVTLHLPQPRGVVWVPHRVDKRPMSDFMPTDPDHLVSIRPAHVAQFVWQLLEAGLVISSSLHALITADALGIPHIYDPHPGVKGGIFKFNDYASAFDDEFVPGVIRKTPHASMAQQQRLMRASFDGLKQYASHA